MRYTTWRDDASWCAPMRPDTGRPDASSDDACCATIRYGAPDTTMCHDVPLYACQDPGAPREVPNFTG
eukprot:3377743-Prymnesium_polylepis.1